MLFPSRVRWLAVLGTLAVTAALSGCGEDPDATSVVSDASTTEGATPATSTSQASEPSATTADTGISLEADTVWMDVFNTLTASEQACVREAVDEELLEAALVRPVSESFDATEEWEIAIFSCVGEQTARALFLAMTIESLNADADLGRELSEGEESCLRDWVAGIDVGTLVAAYASDDTEGVEEYLGEMFSCVPDFALSTLLTGFGVELGDLGEGELSCLYEWIADLDWSAALAGDDPERAESIGGAFSCVPDFALSTLLTEFGVELGDLSEGELSCLYEWIADLDWSAALAGDDPEKIKEFAGLSDCVPALSLLTPSAELESPVNLAAGSFEEATGIAVGEVVTGSLDQSYDSDVFVFEAVEGGLYDIGIALGTLPDSVLTLHNADGWELAYDDAYGDSVTRLVWEAPGSGEYYVQVAGWGDYTGSYTLTVSDLVDDHSNSLAEATSLIVGESVLGRVDYPWDYDVFAFEAVDGESYEIKAALDTLLDDSLTLKLYDADGWELDYESDYGDSVTRLFWEAPGSGSYYVEVTGWLGVTGSYTLTVSGSAFVDDHGHSLAEATSVTVGAPVAGRVDYPWDVDMFVFEAVDGESYEIKAALGTLPESVLVVYDAEGVFLDTIDANEDNPVSRLAWEAPGSGSYYVEVTGWGNVTGSYTLTVSGSAFVDDHGDGFGEATSVTVGAPVAGRVDYPWDVDMFVFEAVDGESYEIVVALGTLPDSTLSVYDADGWELAHDNDYGDPVSQLFGEAPGSGKYYVKVESRDDLTGSYTLTISAR